MTNTVRSAAVRLTMENAQYIRGANQAAGATEQATGRMQRAVRNTAASTGRDWETMGKYGGRYALAVGAGLGFAEKRIMSFDKTMSAAQAATGAQAAQLEKLRAAAIKAGADTAFTSTDAAQAIVEEGKAGISTANILKGGLRGALDLAAAGSIGVGDAAEYTATALVQFHLGGDKARHVADLLAASANKAQGEVTDMSLALSYIGVPAHAAGISLEETVGTIALLAKNGLIGEKAGTSLRGMLASLQSPSKQASKIMSELGINVYDAQGKFKGFDGVAQELHTSLSGLTDQERQYALGKIFGNEQLQAANILYEQGAKGVRKMTREVNDQGYATKVANQKLDNLAGDWERLTGSFESAIIKDGSPAQRGLRDMVQNAEHLVNAFAGLPDVVQQGVVKMLVLTTGIGAALYTISKIRNISRDLRGLGGTRGGVAGGLGRAASMASPVPVFVTNLGAGGLGGVGGKGGPTILGGGSGTSGKIKGFALPRGTGLVLTATGLVLMATGVTGKTHTGSTVGGAVAGGQFGGPAGALIGGGLGALNDVYNSGNSAKDALARAKQALETGTIKEQKAALADLRKEAEKLGSGGWGQNFARGVTELTGRRREIEQTGKALQEALDPKLRRQSRDDLLFLLSGGKRGSLHRPKMPAPEKDPLQTLLGDPTKRPGKKPKELTSEEVLANFYGVNPKKLKPVPLMDKILDMGDIWPNGKPGKSKGGKNAVMSFAASLDLDTSAFDKKAGGAKRTAADLDHTRIAPRVDLTGDDAAIAAIQRIKAEMASIHDKTVHLNYYVNQANAHNKPRVLPGNPDGSADGSTVPKTGFGYADRHLYVLADGEEVVSNRYGQADKWRPLLKAINANRLAGGGTAGVSPVVTQLGPSGTGIDINQLAAVVAGNQLLGHRDNRTLLTGAFETALRKVPMVRTDPGMTLPYGVV